VEYLVEKGLESQFYWYAYPLPEIHAHIYRCIYVFHELNESFTRALTTRPGALTRTRGTLAVSFATIITHRTGINGRVRRALLNSRYEATPLLHLSNVFCVDSQSTFSCLQVDHKKMVHLSNLAGVGGGLYRKNKPSRFTWEADEKLHVYSKYFLRKPALSLWKSHSSVLHMQGLLMTWTR
jgi:hypothetical protein